jgi:hypothetical protein
VIISRDCRAEKTVTSCSNFLTTGAFAHFKHAQKKDHNKTILLVVIKEFALKNIKQEEINTLRE